MVQIISKAKTRKYACLKDLNSNQFITLRLLHTGETNVEIAQQLERTTKTIESYTSAIYEILNVKNRVLAALFYEQFLVDFNKYDLSMDFDPRYWLKEG